jgi:hypothetical protein
VDERRALVERVQGCDRSALRELRAMCAAHPDAAMRLFDPAATLWGDLAREEGNRGDILFPELVVARGDALRRELEGESPTALERLLCERVVTCWLLLHFLEIRAPDPGMASAAAREQHDQMVSRAHGRHLSATLTLARVRRLLRPQVQQVNIAQPGTNQLNLAVADASSGT